MKQRPHLPVRLEVAEALRGDGHDVLRASDVDQALLMSPHNLWTLKSSSCIL